MPGLACHVLSKVSRLSPKWRQRSLLGLFGRKCWLFSTVGHRPLLQHFPAADISSACSCVLGRSVHGADDRCGGVTDEPSGVNYTIHGGIRGKVASDGNY